MVVTGLAMIPERREDVDFADTLLDFASLVIIYKKINPDEKLITLFLRVSGNDAQC